MAHIFTRLVGHGIAVYPAPGLALQRDPDRPSVLQVYQGEDEEPFALDTEDVVGRLEGDEVLKACEGLEVQLSPGEPEWRIETSPFSCSWPAGLALVIPDPPGQPSFFDLVGQDGGSVWIQGPFETAGLPAADELAAEGQTLSASGKDGDARFAELDYELEGTPWVQRYLFVDAGSGTLIVTAQTPAAQLADLRQAMAELAGGIVVTS